MPEAEAVASTVENVRVVVRVRPMDAKETLEGCYNTVSVDTQNHTIAVTRNNDPPRIYAFDAIFDINTSQMDIYNQTASSIVDEVLKGYNGTVFAYGQTGTGKTYTMAGSQAAPELKGIIPNSFAHIFGHIAKAHDDEKFLVCVTYLEIYNEEVRDLLGANGNRRQSLEVKERPDIGVFVKDLTGYVVHNADELERIMEVGNRNRHTGATAMNTESSRSHAIFTITVESSREAADGTHKVRMGKLHLVDLAGSERQSKTQSTGTRLKEATKINQSLSVLGNVISALVDGKSTHIPYRNSKLTRLLQDSLGGNSKTLMIATVGPADSNYMETISTLRYANRAKNIQNKTHVNQEPKDALLTRFQQEIDDLRKQLEDGLVDMEGEESDDLGSSMSEGEQDTEFKERTKSSKDVDSERAIHARKVLEEKQAELQRTKQQQDELREKLQRLESKVLVGGENLLDRAEDQRRLLEQSARELQARQDNEERLHTHLQKKEAERLDMEERYTSLQEENAAKTRKLKRAVQLLNSAKAELADQQREQQREMEGILDGLRALRREMQLADLVVHTYIPIEYQNLLEQYIHWNEEIGEWQVKCVAYTGNNMRNQTKHNKPAKEKMMEPPDISSRYLTYGTGLGNSLAVSTSSISTTGSTGRSSRPHTSGVPRPTTNRSRQRQ